MNPLDSFDSLEFYSQHFTDKELWAPFVRQVCEKHGLGCTAINTGIPGTCPVFIVDQRWVVKFFGRLFHGEEAFQAERCANSWVDQHPVLPHARLVADGQLLPGGDSHWHWPYLVTEYLPGSHIGEVYASLSEKELLRLARQLGIWILGLHSLELPGIPPFEANWDRFTCFLQEQRSNCAARHQAWNSLPAHLVAEMNDFMPSLDSLFDPSRRPCLIHADLTGDHLLGNLEKNRWAQPGIIDFGDARVGNPEYELTVLHLDLFHANRRLLAAFLDAYGYQTGPGFPEKMLAYSLLHEFNVLAPYANCLQANHLSDLASELWTL